MVLHESNNVVVRLGDVVLKVGSHPDRIQREIDVAIHAGRAGGPVMGPLAGPIQSLSFAVSAWPYLASDPRPADDRAAGQALAALHRSLADAPVALPRAGRAARGGPRPAR